MQLSYESSSRKIVIQGFNLHYHDAGSGEVLLCIHGGAPGAFGWGNFGRNVPELAQSFRVLVVDIPGYGESDSLPDEVDPLSFSAKLFADFLQSLNISSATVLGMATGGAVAMSMALETPEFVDKLILVSSSGGHSNFAVPKKSTASQDYFSGEGPSLEKMRAYVDQLIVNKALVTDEVVQERYQASLNYRSTLGKKSKTLTPKDFWKRVDGIQAKTLIVWGRENRAHGFDNAIFLHKAIKNSDLCVFGNCGLWVNYEKLNDFNNLVVHFMKSEG